MLHIIETYNFGIKLSGITDAKEYFLLEYEPKQVSKQNSYKEMAPATQQHEKLIQKELRKPVSWQWKNILLTIVIMTKDP